MAKLQRPVVMDKLSSSASTPSTNPNIKAPAGSLGLLIMLPFFLNFFYLLTSPLL
jgi:hypothetical protein